MFAMNRASVFVLTLNSLVALSATALAADVPAKKMTDAGLYVTAAEAVGDAPTASLEGEADLIRLPGLYLEHSLQDRDGDIDQEANSNIIQPGLKFFMGDNCGVEPPPSM